MSDKKQIELILEKTKKLYTIERANIFKKEDVVNFFKQAYTDQFNSADYQNEGDIIERWNWANLKNPNIEDKDLPAWFCINKQNEEIVGHLGVIPVSIKIKNNRYLAVWGRDMITAMKWRKTGVASLLFNTVMERTKDKVALFLLGGANDYAVTIYKKLGFIHLGHIPLYVRVITVNTVLRKFVGNKLLREALGFISHWLLSGFYMFLRLIGEAEGKNICIKETICFDNAFDVLWEKTSSLFSIIVSRDSKSLTWRFIDQPYGKYRIFKAEDKKDGELKGYIILREGKSHGFNIGIISDIFASPEDNATISSLVKFAIKYFEDKEGLDLIRCDIMCKRFESVLKKFGFIKLRSKSHFLVGNMNETLDASFIFDRSNWFINYADSDLDLSGQRV